MGGAAAAASAAFGVGGACGGRGSHAATAIAASIDTQERENEGLM
jgi:hypothetical protein